MQHLISRRAVVRATFLAGALAPLSGLPARSAAAADLPALDPNDPTAKALGFVTDASTVNAAAHPTFKTGQRCGTCAQFQGKPGEASAGCNIFAGHTVPAAGWCTVWAQRPAG